MAGKEILFDGKEKKIYATENPDEVIIHFNDTTTAYGGIKRAVFRKKGIYSNRISAIIFEQLAAAGIRNHFIKVLGDREQLCRRIEIIPLQVIVRNRLAGSTARLLGLENGTRIGNVITEFRYNCDDLHDPMINEHHAVALGIVSYEEVESILELARRTNEVLKALFMKAGIELVDFKMEVGRDADGIIIISDEISPDNCRLWDVETGRVLDKDRFRHDLGDVAAAYEEVLDRLNKALES